MTEDAIRIQPAGMRSSGIFVLAWAIGGTVLGAPMPWLATSGAPAVASVAVIVAVVAWWAYVVWRAFRRPGWIALRGDTIVCKHAFLPERRVSLAGVRTRCHRWGRSRSAGRAFLAGPAVVLNGQGAASFGCASSEWLSAPQFKDTPELTLGPQYVVSPQHFEALLTRLAAH